MALNFGKLNFAVGFNRTSAFPLDANSYFESYDAAVLAAAGAAEVGSADSAYYIGQLLIVKDSSVGVGLYQINAGKTLTKFGQASSADELAEKISALEARCTTIEGKLIVASQTVDGLMSSEDKKKLDLIADGAQVNIIEGVKLDGVDLVPGEDKKVDVAIAGTYLKKADAESTYVAKVEGKDLSTNDYSDVDKAEVGKVKDKADASVVTAIDGRVTTLEGKISGVTGAMHFKGVVAELPADLSNYEAGDVIIVDKKEYVCAESDSGKEWHELGDEGSHLTKEEAASTYKTIESYNTDKATIDASVEAVSDRVTTIEGDYLKKADKTELETSIKLKADKADLDDAVAAATTLKGRVDTIEGDYLKAVDKTELEGKIDLKADAADLEAAEGKITALEGKVGSVASGDVAATGLFKAIDDEVAARITLAEKVATNESNISTISGLVGTSDVQEGGKEDGTVFERIAYLQANAGKIDSIEVDGTAVTIENKVAKIDLPAALIAAMVGGQDEGTFALSEDGKLQIAKISTDRLVNGEGEFVINGGNATK